MENVSPFPYKQWLPFPHRLTSHMLTSTTWLVLSCESSERCWKQELDSRKGPSRFPMVLPVIEGSLWSPLYIYQVNRYLLWYFCFHLSILFLRHLNVVISKSDACFSHLCQLLATSLINQDTLQRYIEERLPCWLKLDLHTIIMWVDL